MGRFYVSYLQDCGYGAGMWCHGVVEAESISFAKTHWADLLRDQGFSVQLVGMDGKPEELFCLPGWLDELPTSEVLDYLDPPGPCTFKQSVSPQFLGCSANWTFMNGEGKPHTDGLFCVKGHLHYGCYEEKRALWEAKWAVYRAKYAANADPVRRARA